MTKILTKKHALYDLRLPERCKMSLTSSATPGRFDDGNLLAKGRNTPREPCAICNFAAMDQ